ncbi:esterase [Ottowia thiooxydans]|uniref:Esterase n=1 Tax=Ottowia thiooxydans TaxID=219182 RepID=A0ABV2QGG5_9BURK
MKNSTAARLTRALALSLPFATLMGCAQAPIQLEKMGSFHVGGREVVLSGRPVKEIALTAGGVPAKFDPNGVYQVEQMYVQYFIPKDPRGALPLLMWHGGGLSGVTYETTPDGREGWLNYFVKKGWPTYNSDAVERGRSGFAMYPDIFQTEPVYLTKENPFERFRIGQGAGSYSKDPQRMKLLPGNQFPVEAYDQFTKQNVPRWTSTDAPTIAAYTELVDKVCPCVVIVHSQSGLFGARVAQARPDKVKALVMVEPAATGAVEDATKMKNVPVLAIYGDYIAQDPRWPTIRANGGRYFDALRAAGGNVDVIDLPSIGIKGNSHMIMMDKNSDVIAGIIQDWLVKQRLYK